MEKTAKKNVRCNDCIIRFFRVASNRKFALLHTIKKIECHEYKGIS
jgi:hypothetical protein